jgi:SAM-dependent methyltransferase
MRSFAIRSCIDVPAAGELVSGHGFTISGWAYREGDGRLADVWAVFDGRRIGGTSLVFARPDVADALDFRTDTPCGFAFSVTDVPLDSTLAIVLQGRFGDEIETIGAVAVRTSPFDATEQDFGTLANSQFDAVMHRDDIYGVGPPSAIADPRCVANILAYALPGERIVDVGCGIGAYAGPMLEAGRSWHGCEVVPEFVRVLRERGLDATEASGVVLPFEDAAFDLAICVEVLEHIDAYEEFAREIARVARRGALFSVPNCGTIPRYAPLGIVPWHLLESTHVNFFTASSLRSTLERAFSTVEVVEYGRLPVDAADGTPMYNHLFAVAMHDPAS